MDEPATLRDVAQHAGVSLATASRALRPGFAVADETRTRVIRAAEALNYRGNPRQSRSLPMIGVVVHSIRHQVVGSIMSAVNDCPLTCRCYPCIPDHDRCSAGA